MGMDGKSGKNEKRALRACRRWPELTGAADAAFARTGAATLLTGRTATQRAEALAEQVAAAVRSGADPRDLLVLCADPSTAARMRQRLQERAGAAGAAGGLAGVAVMTCRELACSVIEQPAAARATGTSFSAGRARILAAYEADFVTEDVKTLGTRPKRLRELLKFLYRGWTELLDEDPAWLFMAEEIDTVEFLLDELLYLGAIMEPQVSNLATKALRLDAGLRAQFVRRQVFVLDYQNLSRASQLLCQLVADDLLVAAADPGACAEVHESYPYLAGVEEFARLNPAAQVVALDGAGATDGERADGVLRTERSWATPRAEIEGTADAIAAAVTAGCAPEDIGVMAPHPWWAQQMERALKARGVPANCWYGPLKLRGDIRDLERSLVPRAVTLLRLIADPQDGVAWRSWFGFGDYLTRSNQFATMRATVPGAGAPDVKQPSGTGAAPDAGTTPNRNVRRDLEAFGYDLGADLDPLFAEVRDLRGPELLGYLVATLAGPDAPVPPALRPLLALGLDADAAQMVAELDRRQFFAGIPQQPGVVVSSYDTMAGLDFVQVYAMGFVNGLFPSAAYFDLTRVSIEKQQKMGERDLRTARAMARLGRRELHVSRFERADCTFAERVGLKQERIFAVDDTGTPLAEASPSIYTDVLLGRA